MIFRFVFFCALAACGVQSQASQHPFETAVRDLGRVAGSLDNLDPKASADPDVKKTAEDLRKRISDMEMEALMAPLRVKAARIQEFGYEVSWRQDPTHNYMLFSNAPAETLKTESQQLRPQRWQALRKLVAAQKANLADLSDLRDQRDVVSVLSADDRRILDDVAALSHSQAYEQLDKIVETNLTCIAEISAAYQQTGLRPVKFNGQPVGWSVEDLQRTYGVTALDRLPADKLQPVIDALLSLRHKAAKNGFECVPKETVLFFTSEANRLKAAK
jgi:hypothetical protein